MEVMVGRLELRRPNNQGKNIDMRALEKDIRYATDEFNKRFTGIKEISISTIDPTGFEFTLQFDSSVVSGTPRDLKFFSARLSHDRGWKKYSLDENQLLKASTYEVINRKPIITKKGGVVLDVNELISDEDCLKLLGALIVIKEIGENEVKQRRQSTVDTIKTLLYSEFVN